ncbi:MAG: hypothetical protein IPN69_02415 [Acidobacteria bacterium]|nr:hypothetical protein [Acidobacteriota bacterium]
MGIIAFWICDFGFAICPDSLNTQNNGSLRSQKITFAGLTTAYDQTYTYDDLNRLKSAEEKIGTTTNWKQTFDAASTTTISVSNTVTNPSASTSTNRLNGHTYDPAGNLTVDAENRRFVYDAENHQTKLFGTANNSETPDAILTTRPSDPRPGMKKDPDKATSFRNTRRRQDSVNWLAAGYVASITHRWIERMWIEVDRGSLISSRILLGERSCMKLRLLVAIFVICVGHVASVSGQSRLDKFSVKQIFLETDPNPRFVWHYANTIISMPEESNDNEVSCLKTELMNTGLFKSIESRLEKSRTFDGYNLILSIKYKSADTTYAVSKIALDGFESVNVSRFEELLASECLIGKSLNLKTGYRDFENRIIELLKKSISDEEERDEFEFPFFSLKLNENNNLEVMVMPKFAGCPSGSL